MKSIKYYGTSLLTALFLMLSVISCDKDLTLTEQLGTLEPTNIDEDAETWASVNLDTYDVTQTKIYTAAETAVGPAAKIFDPANDVASVQNIGSASYQSELASIKDMQSKLTGEQRKAIEYWSGGGVLRWNQILRGLVARYNLPPAPKPDGSYPGPDAENPFADPNFPFANPPYAARAYAYVSAAQYEALKAAWHYMYLYDRPSPYKNDSGVKSLMPETDLPSYPSYDAVMSGVTAEMLKLLFPTAVEEITRKAAEQRNAAIWSGRASTSDVAKGLALGKSVAGLFTTRARGDRMGNSGGSKPQWQALADTAVSNGEIPWVSLEAPKRPPMLPFFGLRKTGVSTGCKAWLMTDNDIVNNRPGPPPSTASEQMVEETKEVKYYSDNLTRERLAIVHKWADGVNTYTPPGHWNDIAAEYIRDSNFSEVRTARAFALLNMALHDAGVACWDTKFFYFNPRPSQLNNAIKTGTGVPNFPAYTSGHSTFSGAAAEFLSYLFPEHSEYFNDQALEAALSRMYGGIHYRSDSEVGLAHGKVIGGFAVGFASTDGAD